MMTVKVHQEERLDEYKYHETENEKRNTDLRRSIREEKAQHRELSMTRRVETKADQKVFSKFVNAHDEKLILRQHKVHE